MKKIICLCLFLSILLGEAMVVHDPTNAANIGQMITQLTESIKKYEEMISKANEQVNKLGQISQFMDKTNKLISGSNLTIANPMEILENLKDNLERIKRSYKRLEKTFKDYDFKNHIKAKRIGAKCPWLRWEVIDAKTTKMIFANNGEETPLMKDARELIELMSDNVYSNFEATLGTLSGRALAEMLCETVVEEEYRKQINNLTALEKKAIFDGNQAEFDKLRMQRMQTELKKKITDQTNLENKIQPLYQRVVQMKEALGVQDKEANKNDHNIKYCEEGKNDEGEFCYPILLSHLKISQDFNDLKAELNNGLSSAGTNKDAQSAAYANFNQKGQILMLEYLRELSQNLSFLNETMALTSSLLADDFKRRYQTNIIDKPVNNETFAEESEILQGYRKSILELKKPVLDKYGFPTPVGKTSEENGES